MGSDIRDIISGQFNKILDVLHEGYILVGEDANIIDANPAYCNMVGYTKEELLGMDLHQIRPGMSLEYQKEFIQKARKEGSVEFETKHRTKSGEMIDLLASAGTIEADGKVYLAGLIRDITDQKEAEQKLEETKRRFQSLFNNNPQPVYYFDLEGNFIGANKRTEEVSGYSEDELLSMNFAPIIVEEDLERTQQHFQSAAAGSVEVYEIKIQTKKNDIKHLRVTNFAMKQGEEIAGVFGVAEDITEANEAKQKLEESEQRFKSLFEQNPNAVYSFDLEGNFIMTNDELEVLTGYSVQELQKMNFEPLTKQEDRERVWDHFEKAAKGQAQRYEASGVHKQGHEVHFYVTNLPIYVNNEIVGVFGIAQDITEQKELQKQLKKSQQRWRHLVEDNPQPVQVTVDAEVVFINQAGANLYGAGNPEEIIGKSVFEFSYPGFEKKIKERKRRLENDEAVDMGHEHKIMRLDGESRSVEVHSIPIEYQDRAAIQTVLHDITNRKKQEQIIKKALKEKEVLLKEIHHRVKNNMAVISGLLQLQAMSTEEEALQEMLQESQLRIYSMAMVHEKLYQKESFSDINFDVYIKELVQNIRDTVDDKAKDIRLAFDLEELTLNVNQAIPCALIINEFVINCFKHAFKAGQAGKIVISLYQKEDQITISVEDNGVGLPHNFEIEECQSLGMSLIQTLVQQLNGDLDYTSGAAEKGSKFSVSFD